MTHVATHGNAPGAPRVDHEGSHHRPARSAGWKSRLAGAAGWQTPFPRLTHGPVILLHAVNDARIAESTGAADARMGVAVESSLSHPEQALAAVPFFSLLAGEELVPLARLLQAQQVATDEVICGEGQPGDAFFIVRSGSVKVCRPQTSGNEVLLNILGPGECFGELALLDGKPRSATVQALEPTALWILPRLAFLDFLADHPKATMALLQVLSERMRRLTDRVAEASFLGLAQRLARRLVELSDQRGTSTADGVSLGVGATADSLAALLGVSSPRVRLILHAWEAEGIVRVGEQGTLSILRSDELARLAH
jgi:CRP/FNR family transcriptional regulator, cyclic AMP receptor protein